MMKVLRLFVITLILTGQACHAGSGTLPTVEKVEIQRYIGKWYAISSLPQFFTRNCLGQTAEYEIINGESVSVLNTCFKKKGKIKTIQGKAVVTNHQTNASLEVTFDNFWTRLFRVKGDYQILRLDQDYEYVMVGSNNLKSLWIMSRSTSIPEDVYRDYIQTAQELGFDTSRLIHSEF